MKEKKGIIIAAVLLLLVCAGAAILYGKFRPSGEAGSKNVTVVVVHGDQSEQTFEYHTDAAYLGEVLEAEQLVEAKWDLMVYSSLPWTERRLTIQSSSGGVSPRAAKPSILLLNRPR